MRRLSLLVLALCALFGARTAHAQTYKVIVNAANTATALPNGEIAQLFLKKKTTWPGGAPVVPVDLPAGAVRAAFSQAVLNRDVNAMQVFWQQQTFAGRGTAPEVKSSDAAVIAFVKDTPGAIGYVSAAAATAGVKVVATH